MNAIERLVKQWYGFGGPYADCADDLNALLPELREMARDAARYRWLRDDCGDDWEELGWAHPNEFDSIVDAAIAKAKP
ncbi:hypothetical protein [Lysobacter olei]